MKIRTFIKCYIKKVHRRFGTCMSESEIWMMSVLRLVKTGQGCVNWAIL